MHTSAFPFQIAHFIENAAVPSNLYAEVEKDLRNKTERKEVF